MEKKHFNKQSLTIDQQIEFLVNQGLVIQNTEIATHVLSVVGYYRLSGYLLPFKLPHHNKSPRQFKPETTFDQIWQLYQFDQELKLFVIDAIEKIEVAFRASITNETASELNPFWYVDQRYYKDTKSYQHLMKNINKIIKDRQEVFIEHYYNKYKSPTYPPIWMMTETLSFGSCSKLFSNLKQVSHKKKICKMFKRAPTLMDSWLETLVYVRNLCAHHARLWNRWLVTAPIIPKDVSNHLEMTKSNRKFIAVAYIISELLKEVAPKSAWKEKLMGLFEKYESYPGVAMGFKKDWRSDPFWKL